MDKYYVYRPILDLIMKFEGTLPGRNAKARGYNTTLDYDAYTGGPVELVRMTLAQVDDLQGRMLAHPKNKWNSSAAGAYQIVRRTRRGIEAKLKLSKGLLFNADMQDRMACFLLGQRGIDKWLSGRMKLETLLTNLSAEWASFPKPDGKGTYKGQGVGGKVAEVISALEEVKHRHLEGQPVKETVPAEVEEKVREKGGLWQKLTGGGGVAALGLGGIVGADWQTLAVIAASVVVILLLIVLLQNQIVAAVRKIRDGLA